MAEQQDVCSLLIVSRDLEWIHAFTKGLARFYRVQEEVCDSLEEMEKLLAGQSFDIVVLSPAEGLPGADKVHATLQRLKLPLPLVMIDAQGLPMDEGIKQGADYVIGRRDLLSAIKTAQQIMHARRLEHEKQQANAHYEALVRRYDRIYLDVPDPVCYVQDGLFLDVNPAFLRTFAVEKREMLDDLTLMNFVPRKSEKSVKEMLRMALQKEVVPAETIEWHSLSGEKLELQMQVSKVQIDHEEDVVQVYLRGAGGGGAGGGGIDASTGLPGYPVLRASIRQTQERQQEQKLLGIWTYILVDNYREVWQKDGYHAAEILITAVADTLRHGLPPSTEMARFTDDGLILWAQDDKETVIKRIQALVLRLDEIVPDNVERLVHPRVFAGMQEVYTKTPLNDLVSRSFRAARALATGQSGERIAEPTSGTMSRNDERRVLQLQRILEERRVKITYQPISALEPDGVPRYAERVTILSTEEEHLEGEDIAKLLQTADRYGLARQIDRVKINSFLQDVLSYDGDQKALRGFIPLTADALNDETFAAWTQSQFKQTGIGPEQAIFEMSIDVLNNAFSGALNFISALRPLGTQFALTEIGRFDEDVRELLSRMKPDVIKLDMREIDTFEDDEEQRFMAAVKNYTDENGVLIIADYMESPAQLSRVWPYDIKLLQGNGMVPPMDGFNFDFTEPLF